MQLFTRLSVRIALTALFAAFCSTSPVMAEGAALDTAAPWRAFVPTSFPAVDLNSGAIWRLAITPPKASYMYVYFNEVTVGDDLQAQLEIRSEDGRSVAAYDSDFLRTHRSFRTGQLAARKAFVVVKGPVKAGALNFKIAQILIVPYSSTSKSLSLNLNLVPLEQLRHGDVIRTWARAVAKLTIADNYLCTGFLVRPTLLITNYHCLQLSATYRANAKQCSDITFTFDYDSDRFPAAPEIRCKSVEKEAPQPTDLAALRLSQPALGSSRQLDLAQSNTAVHPVTILEHPFGYPTMVEHCVLGTDLQTVKIRHDCSSTGGASGSPILDDDGKVIAVHSNGYARDDASERELLDAFYKCLNDPQNPPRPQPTCGLNLATHVSELTKLIDGVP